MNVHNRVQSDFDKFLAEYPNDLETLKLLCIVLSKIVVKTQANVGNPVVRGINSQVSSNLFVSLDAYVFHDKTTNDKLLVAPTPQYQYFLTALASVVHYVQLKKRITVSVTNALTSWLFFGIIPNLDLLLQWPVIENCFLFSQLRSRRPKDVEAAAVIVLPLLQESLVNPALQKTFLTATNNYLALKQKCFTFQGRLRGTGVEQNFSGKLYQRKCAVPSCYTWVDVGLPYCKAHLESELHLEIKPSTIPSAGLGVFAKGRRRRGAVFQADQKICEYLGEKLRLPEIERRYGSRFAGGKEFTAPYVLEVKTNLFVDGALLRGVGTMINHSDSKSLNCFFHKNMVYALKPIYHGQELLVSYGSDYFRNDPDLQEVHETKVC